MRLCILDLVTVDSGTVAQVHGNPPFQDRRMSRHVRHVYRGGSAGERVAVGSGLRVGREHDAPPVKLTMLSMVTE
jgi:hypothetical protein